MRWIGSNRCKQPHGAKDRAAGNRDGSAQDGQPGAITDGTGRVVDAAPHTIRDTQELADAAAIRERDAAAGPFDIRNAWVSLDEQLALLDLPTGHAR